MPKLFSRTDTKTAKKTLAIFRSEIVKDKGRFALYSTLIPANRLFYIVLLPLLFSLIIQSLILHPHNWQYPVTLLGASAILSLLSLFTAYFGFKLLFQHEEAMRTRLTERAIKHLMHHSDQFFANRKIGSLAGDVNTFSGSILSFLDILFLQASSIVINFGFSLIIIAFMSPILLLPLGVATGLLIWRSLVAVSARAPIRHKRKTLTSQLNGTVADILGNQQIVRYFATNTSEINRVVTDRKEIEAIAFREIDIIQRETLARQVTLFTFQIVTIAALVFAVTYLGRLTGSLFEITPIIRGMEQAFLDAANITDILDEKPEV
jgi:ABC-type multidrug transport system fused ATPase/permease subunit